MDHLDNSFPRPPLFSPHPLSPPPPCVPEHTDPMNQGVYSHSTWPDVVGAVGEDNLRLVFDPLQTIVGNHLQPFDSEQQVRTPDGLYQSVFGDMVEEMEDGWTLHDAEWLAVYADTLDAADAASNVEMLGHGRCLGSMTKKDGSTDGAPK